MNPPDLRGRRCIVASHVYATGPSHQLVDYLRSRTNEVIFIAHPFPYAKDTRSYVRVYRGGTLIKEKKFWAWGGPDLLFYLKDTLLTLWWALPYASQALFIGVDGLNTLCGYALKTIGLVQTLVFYTIDYIPQRSPNPMLNRLYHWMDRKAVRGADRVWNLSPVMAQERDRRGVAPRYQSKQIVVPIGTVMDEATVNTPREHTPVVAFMGHLRTGQGAETLLAAMPRVIQTVPEARLLMIGGGPLTEPLQQQAQALGIASHVTFTGFVEKFSDMMALLRQASVAVAPYVDDEQTFTRYTDPGKPKDYLAAGLPVVITRVPRVAWEIAERGCGLAVNDDKKEIAHAITRLLQDKQLWQTYRANALAMAADYAWDKVFDRALTQTLP